MKKRMALALAAALAGTAACDTTEGGANAETTPETEAPELDPELAAHLPQGVSVDLAIEGREIFPTCGVCHGMEGEGTQLGPSLRDGEWIHTDGSLEGITTIIQAGVQSPRDHPIPMPPLGGGAFGQEQLEAVAAYTFLLGRSGAPAETADTTADTTAASAPAADSARPDTAAAGAPR